MSDDRNPNLVRAGQDDDVRPGPGTDDASVQDDLRRYAEHQETTDQRDA